VLLRFAIVKVLTQFFGLSFPKHFNSNDRQGVAIYHGNIPSSVGQGFEELPVDSRETGGC